MKKERRKIPPHAKNVGAKPVAMTSRSVDRLQSRFEFNATLVPGCHDVSGDQIIETGVCSVVRRTASPIRQPPAGFRFKN